MAIFALSFMMNGCSALSKRNEAKSSAPAPAQALDRAISELSLQQLGEAETVFRAAFDKSLESWQGAGDDSVLGCKITGREAETALSAMRPWIDLKLGEEAKRLLDSPKSYQLPVDVETCEQACTCGLGIKIFESANLDNQSHQKVKEFKRLRTRLEAKSELLTADRAEICAEAATWICKSELLKALRPKP